MFWEKKEENFVSFFFLLRNGVFCSSIPLMLAFRSAFFLQICSSNLLFEGQHFGLNIYALGMLCGIFLGLISLLLIKAWHHCTNELTSSMYMLSRYYWFGPSMYMLSQFYKVESVLKCFGTYN